MASHGVPEGTTFVWEQAEKRLEAQLNQADSLDTKAGALVGLHALAAGLVGTVAGHLSGTSRWIASGAIIGLAASGLVAFGAFRSEFLTTRFDSLDRNRAKLSRKARLISVSLAGFAMVALAVAIAALIDLLRLR
jgi:hypothetical protein